MLFGKCDEIEFQIRTQTEIVTRIHLMGEIGINEVMSAL